MGHPWPQSLRGFPAPVRVIHSHRPAEVYRCPPQQHQTCFLNTSAEGRDGLLQLPKVLVHSVVLMLEPELLGTGCGQHNPCQMAKLKSKRKITLFSREGSSKGMLVRADSGSPTVTQLPLCFQKDPLQPMLEVP